MSMSAGVHVVSSVERILIHLWHLQSFRVFAGSTAGSTAPATPVNRLIECLMEVVLTWVFSFECRPLDETLAWPPASQEGIIVSGHNIVMQY